MRRRGMMRAGRPGLVGTMARTAVIAGTASTVAGGVSRRQQAKAAETQDAEAIAAQQQAEYQQALAQQAAAQQAQQAQQVSPPAAPPIDVVSQLKELAALRDQGILTDAEFETQKARILA